jgi:N-acetylmuramoyl-L-alanine amidase
MIVIYRFVMKTETILVALVVATLACALFEFVSGQDCPRIVSRKEWKARTARKSTAMARPVAKVFIHHTETKNCSTLASCSAVVRSIQNYHMDEKKWSDIAYNFLVGEDGNVYEGRGWKIVGSHCTGWNTRAYGIAFIGKFTKTLPKVAALNAAKALIACGVKLKNISSNYTLHGHRDAKSTDCPGDPLYNLIKTWPQYGGKLV